MRARSMMLNLRGQLVEQAMMLNFAVCWAVIGCPVEPWVYILHYMGYNIEYCTKFLYWITCIFDIFWVNGISIILCSKSGRTNDKKRRGSASKTLDKSWNGHSRSRQESDAANGAASRGWLESHNHQRVLFTLDSPIMYLSDVTGSDMSNFLFEWIDMARWKMPILTRNWADSGGNLLQFVFITDEEDKGRRVWSDETTKFSFRLNYEMLIERDESTIGMIA